MNTTQAGASVQWKVGIFTVVALLIIGAATVLVNDKPFWWRPCQLVYINVEDATGLKTKSPIRSLGLQIGYLKSVALSETHVSLGICVTAPVEVIPTTRAYIRSEGFLGDKFVELKPVRYVGPDATPNEEKGNSDSAPPVQNEKTPEKPLKSGETQESSEEKQDRQTASEPESESIGVELLKSSWILLDHLIPSAHAEEGAAPNPEPRAKPRGREIPVGQTGQDVQQLVNQVNDLVKEMTSLTSNLKEAINPKDLRATMQQLNKTLENASRTLSPEGNLNTTAQRTLAKLEDAIEQLRDMMTRVNRGEGSVGQLLNDPFYAEEIKRILKNANQLLSKVGGVRFIVDVGGSSIPAYDGTRGWGQLSIWPNTERYYRLGVTVDPRGKRTNTTTTTTVGGVSTTVVTTQIEDGAFLLNGMIGQVFFHRLDLSVGVLHGDGTLSAKILLGPKEREDRLELINDLYSRGQGTGLNNRLEVLVRPWKALYFRSGLDSFTETNGRVPYFVGAGVAFDDEDIKLIFALR